MPETITLDKKVLMDLLSTTAQMAALYALGEAPCMNQEGFFVSIERQLDRGALYCVHIDPDVREHICAIVNNLRTA